MTMTTIVVIGFTPPQSYAIEMLAQMTAKDLVVAISARDSQRTEAVNIAELMTQHGAQGAVIDIEGAALPVHVGQDMAQFTQQVLGCPVVLVTRQAVSSPATGTNPYWLSAPYNRDQMTQALQWLKDTIDKNPRPAQPIPTAPSLSPTPNAPARTSSDEAPNQPVADAEQRQQVFDILAQTFASLPQTGLFALAKQLQQSHGFACLTINGQSMYINANERSALANRIDRMMDHFIVGQSLGDESFRLEPISAADYQAATASLLAQGQQKIAISQMLWRMGLEILRRGDYPQTHTLRFMAKQMPNFGGTGFVPSYVTPLVASCLGRARTLADLQGLFDNLTVNQINQVLILLVLTGNVQPKALIGSSQQHPQTSPAAVQTTAQTAVNSNQGVQQAGQNGFLKRFLGRLGVKF